MSDVPELVCGLHAPHGSHCGEELAWYAFRRRIAPFSVIESVQYLDGMVARIAEHLLKLARWGGI